MHAQRPEAIRSLIHTAFLSYENGRHFFISDAFLLPGKRFFNEKFADTSLVIPEKKMKLGKTKDKIVNQLFATADESPVEVPLEDDSWWIVCWTLYGNKQTT